MKQLVPSSAPRAAESVAPQVRQEAVRQAGIEAFVQQQLGASVFKTVEGQRYLQKLAGELYAVVRQQPEATAMPEPGARQEAQRSPLVPFFSEVLFRAVQHDSTLLWLVTSARMEIWLRSRVKEASDGRSGRSEWRHSILVNALATKGGGRTILTAFGERLHHPEKPLGPTAFYAFLRHAIKNALLDELRKKGLRVSLEREIHAVADTRDEEHPGTIVQAKHAHEPEQVLRRQERLARRQWLLDEIQKFAARHPNNPNCKMMTEFLTWKAADPDDEARTQLAFAHRFGHKPGQVNSCLKRFRDQFAEAYKDLNMQDFYTTMGGD